MIKHSIFEIKDKLKKKEISCVELTKSYLEEIEKQKDLNAFITTCKDEALEKAKISDERYSKGQERKLEGIPLAIKDLFCTNGIKTTAASKILHNFVPFYESTVTQNLWDEGALCIGKTNMDEFAMGSMNQYSHFGPCYNPLRTKEGKRLIPGGSSGGSAVAVAANLAAASLGSDTGGSIRQPAAFCGVTGIKPTYGLCSRFGMMAFASSLDQAGPMAKNVKDAALILETMAGHDPKDATSLNVNIPKYSENIKPNVKGKKVCVFKECIDDASGDNKSLMKKAIKVLEENGASVDYGNFPLLKESTAVYYIIAPTEASANLSRYDGVRYGRRSKNAKTIEEVYTLSRGEGFGSEVKRRILMGTYILSKGHYDAYYLRAQKIQMLLKKAYAEIFEKYDVVLSPAAPTTAFPVDEIPTDHTTIYLNDLYTTSVNLAGLPGLTLPFAQASNGLPLSCQLIGPRLSEQTLFNIGQLLEFNKNI